MRQGDATEQNVRTGITETKWCLTQLTHEVGHDANIGIAMRAHRQ